MLSTMAKVDPLKVFDAIRGGLAGLLLWMQRYL